MPWVRGELVDLLFSPNVHPQRIGGTARVQVCFLFLLNAALAWPGCLLPLYFSHHPNERKMDINHGHFYLTQAFSAIQ